MRMRRRVCHVEHLIMHPAFVCSLFCVLLTGAVAAYPFTPCTVDGVTPPIKPTSVDLTPTPLRIGHTARFKIKGTYGNA